jgi:hypothetical protein
MNWTHEQLHTLAHLRGALLTGLGSTLPTAPCTQHTFLAVLRELGVPKPHIVEDLLSLAVQVAEPK